jgi:dienelactone hydrolase
VIVIPLLLLITAFEPILLLIFMLLTSVSGAGINVLYNSGFKALTIAKRTVLVIGLIIGIGGIIASVILYIPSGFDTEKTINAALHSDSYISEIKAESPGNRGNYKVKTLSYGSGKDKHRKIFGSEVTIKTDSVDGVAFIDNWKGFGGWWRTRYWGFDSRALPLNARVWYPDGNGPFPLVLVVHGNHSMQDYSDPGYDYLGELLASRGFILASVDENFINGSWSDIFGGLDTENDARGWLLLEHLRVWHQWNESPDNLFYGKVDTARIALIGHSRGGEAIGHAAMLNALPYYPDDASIKLNYNFNIKSVVAIAPVDGQYEPGDSRTKFENVSYFVLHGAQDADVRSFMGSQQFERVSFTDSLYHFKSGLYIYGANHGQFNTTWGNNDSGHPFTGLLNLQELLPAEDQRQIAEVYISAFLETTLNEENEYLPLFSDSRTGRNWLPETVYLNQFQDSNTRYFCSFDEDFNVITTSERGGNISADKLTVWREQEIQLKWEKKGSRALFVGWNYEDFLEENEEAEKDSILTLPDSIVASYHITIDPYFANIDSTSVLIFSMAESTEDSDPKSSGKWVSDEEEDEDEDEEAEDVDEDEDEEEDDEKEKDEDKDVEKPIDFTIELADSLGQVVRFTLSDFSFLQREIEVIVWKIDILKDDKESEKIFQLFQYPLKDLSIINPEFNFKSIKKLSFIFNLNEEGVVVIDNIGFMKDIGSNGTL